MKALTGIVVTLLCIAVAVQQWQIRQMAEMVGGGGSLGTIEGIRIDAAYVLDVARQANQPNIGIEDMRPIDAALLRMVIRRTLGDDWQPIGNGYEVKAVQTDAGDFTYAYRPLAWRKP